MEIKLYHTNDIHSHLSTFSKISRYLEDRASDSYYVDLGDHVDRSHPFTEGTLGKGNIQLLNQANVKVATIGNNEGITLNHDDFNTLYDEALFQITCCNLFDFDGALPRHIKPYVIDEFKGIRFGFIGATAEFTPFYKALGWKVTEPIEAIRKQMEIIHDQCDVVIILSHLGMFADRRIAEEIAGIDIILGAHTHHHFEQGERVNGVLIGAAGRYGEYIGEMTLQFEQSTLVKKEARLIDTDELADSEDSFYEQGRLALSDVVYNQPVDLPRRLYSASYTTALLARQLRVELEADCALINTGLIVKGYNGDHFTKYDLHKMLPHPINSVKITLTGRELKEIIAVSAKHEYRDEIVKGFGFRGDLFGMYVLDNIGFIQSERKFFVGDRLIDDKQTYSLATLDMYTFGRFFPQFVQNEKDYKMPEFLRDIMERALFHRTDILI
ncbi:bifunctional metallophosphatase/5'-nucleotidase [Macrococcus hajekii]|uniref:Bifunctional metallophosphatase/5'-nucleotidase n=1 Tax=Macrococcus hajekii TaxID=198482 RepID=A0A4R6BNQ9_9STAP|nr:bifunctional UDP-sugar hydrolase/5'-nucleotidase [Macrococcus hajekii]TDM03500.1 bifunctional metallophosphatase/5'-nucleotidase [Macrococcus hajekii]GGA99354.1 multifunctional 2',3'-cyclic-nucleotide 2'-phosphodiesterase/5'-nucleotidase/3'-nucleotidase [Macrococcus hajekii]